MDYTHFDAPDYPASNTPATSETTPKPSLPPKAVQELERIRKIWNHLTGLREMGRVGGELSYHVLPGLLRGASKDVHTEFMRQFLAIFPQGWVHEGGRCSFFVRDPGEQKCDLNIYF